MIFLIYSFIFGISIGSFINVILWRLPRKESIISPRSYCPKCQNKITWKDNIQIISWIILDGKCRFCSQKINSRYPTIELITGLAFVVSSLSHSLFFPNFPYIINIVSNWFLISICIPLFVFDIKYLWLPKLIIYIGIIIGLILIFTYSIAFEENLFFNNLISAFLGFFILYFINFIGKRFISKNVIGKGDMKLMFMFGTWLGIKGILISLYISFLTSGLICLILFSLKKIKRGAFIPFAPFLIFSCLLVWFFGTDTLIQSYIYFFNYLFNNFLF